MTAANFEAILQHLTNRRPFGIFTVELVNGRKFEVDHPRAIAFRNGVGIFIGPGTVIVDFDHEGVANIIEAPADALGSA